MFVLQKKTAGSLNLRQLALLHFARANLRLIMAYQKNQGQEEAKKRPRKNKPNIHEESQDIHNIFRFGAAEELGEWKRRGIASSRPICPMFGTTRRSLDCCESLSTFVNICQRCGGLGLERNA